MELCNRLADLLGANAFLFNEKVIAVNSKHHCVILQTSSKVFKCSYVIMTQSPEDLLRVRFTPELEKERDDLLRGMQRTQLKTFVISSENKKNFRRIYNDSARLIRSCRDCFLGSSFTIDEYSVLKSLKPYLDTFTCHFSWSSHLQLHPRFVPDLGCMVNFDEIRKPFRRTYFAGSETAISFYGMAEGSARSGFRAGFEQKTRSGGTVQKRIPLQLLRLSEDGADRHR
ncbi:PREDICTED: uncharacterized protein LOC108561310, partial [Nicrophorus vespilloides]|uniref:Uncharacterized protein LOC108561310 n=1 Tax=Nicrophorus vespilloides TaxID=110193 RepID=A0ABM1MJB9_NICVS